MEPRGIRLCNPMNIRLRDGIHWVGQSPVQTDGVFVQFDDPVYGIRAGAKIILHYETLGINTLQACINRWAPPTENNTEAYVTAISNACHVAPTDVIDFKSVMPELIAAMIFHENGENPYSPEQIAAGINLAEA